MITTGAAVSSSMKAQALGRVARVERHVGAAGLEDGEQRDDQRRSSAPGRRPPGCQGRRPARAGARRAGWLARPARRSCSARRRSSSAVAPGVRAACSLEELRDRGRWRVARRGAVPIRQQLAARRVSSMGRSAIVWAGSATTASSRARKWSRMRATVGASNRSLLYSKQRQQPVAAPAQPGGSGRTWRCHSRSVARSAAARADRAPPWACSAARTAPGTAGGG